MADTFLTKLAAFLSQAIKDFKPITLEIKDPVINVVNNKDGSLTQYNKEKNELNINLTELSKNDQIIFGEIIKDGINNDKEIFLSLEESQKKLSDWNNSFSQNGKEIEFFKGKIPDRDYIILQSAVYVQSLYSNKNSSEGDRIKNEIINKYGEISRNIINLYGSNYYTSQIKPLYEILAENNMSDSFHEMYQIIVVESRYVMFVNSNQSFENVLFLLKEKIKSNRDYHIDRINVHGINKSNVEKIEKTISLIREELLDEPVIIKKGDTIIAKLKLKIEGENQQTQHTNRIDLKELCNP